eukprot:TRINITY_DN2261_c0_g1_i1.p1 TRINITY_DN2261_c0_g1~~TRINITY_DN2261_c0_g1_i1.p1  ORF type:complete len:1148 (-),score=339.89 TRINITY_DN2261_c0_g1_i1:93-3536(-)
MWSKSKTPRFQEKKDTTPGPGHYNVPAPEGARGAYVSKLGRKDIENLHRSEEHVGERDVEMATPCAPTPSRHGKAKACTEVAVAVLKDEVQDLKRELKDSQQQTKRLGDEAARKMKDADQAQGKIAVLNERLKKLFREKAEVEAKRATAEKNLHSLQSSNSVLKGQQTKQSDKTNSKLAALEKKCVNAEARLEKVGNELNEATDRILAQTATMEGLTTQLSRAKSERKESKRERSVAMEQAKSLESALEQKKCELTSLMERSSRLESDLRDKTALLTDAQESLVGTQNELAVARDDATGVREELDEARTQLGDVRSEIAASHDRLVGVETRLVDTRDELRGAHETMERERKESEAREMAREREHDKMVDELTQEQKRKVERMEEARKTQLQSHVLSLNTRDAQHRAEMDRVLGDAADREVDMHYTIQCAKEEHENELHRMQVSSRQEMADEVETVKTRYERQHMEHVQQTQQTVATLEAELASMRGVVSRNEKNIEMSSATETELRQEIQTVHVSLDHSKESLRRSTAEMASLKERFDELRARHEQCLVECEQRTLQLQDQKKFAADAVDEVNSIHEREVALLKERHAQSLKSISKCVDQLNRFLETAAAKTKADEDRISALEQERLQALFRISAEQTARKTMEEQLHSLVALSGRKDERIREILEARAQAEGHLCAATEAHRRVEEMLEAARLSVSDQANALEVLEQRAEFAEKRGDAILADIGEISAQKARVDGSLRTLEEMYEESQKEVKLLKATLSRVESISTDGQAEMSSLSSEHALLRSELESAHQTYAHMESEMLRQAEEREERNRMATAAMEMVVRTSHLDLDNSQKQLTEEKEANFRLRIELEELQGCLTRERVQFCESLDTAQRGLESATVERHATEAEDEAWREEVAGLEEECASLHADKTRADDELSYLNSEIKRMTAECSGLSSALDESRRTAERVEQEKQRAAGERDVAVKQVAATRQHIDALTLELKRLKPSGDVMSKLKEERDRLKRDYDVTNGELKSVTQQNDQLVGHSNHRQKIRQHLKVKEENNTLKMEKSRLEAKIKRLEQEGQQLKAALPEEVVRSICPTAGASQKRKRVASKAISGSSSSADANKRVALSPVSTNVPRPRRVATTRRNGHGDDTDATTRRMRARR